MDWWIKPVIGLVFVSFLLGSGAFMMRKHDTPVIQALQSQLTSIKNLAKQQEAKNKQDKAKTDAQAKKDLTSLQSDNDRLRQQWSNRPSILPDSGGSKLACFDRTEFDEAIRQFTEGAFRITKQGDENTLRLKLATEWASLK